MAAACGACASGRDANAVASLPRNVRCWLARACVGPLLLHLDDMPDAPSDKTFSDADMADAQLSVLARLRGSFLATVVLVFFGLLCWTLGSPLLPMGMWGGELMIYVLLAVGPVLWVVLYRRNSTRKAMVAPWSNLSVFCIMVGILFLLAAVIWPDCPDYVAPIGEKGLYSWKQAEAFSAKAPVSARQAFTLLAERVGKGEVIGEKDKWARELFMPERLEKGRLVFFVLKGRYFFPTIGYFKYNGIRRWYGGSGCFVDPVTLQMDFIDSSEGIWPADCACDLNDR